MGTPYSTQTVSGYNSSPPADDGSVNATNQVKWSTIKTKLPDPLKTTLEAINSALVTAFDFSVNSRTSNYTTLAADHMRTVEAAPSVSTAVTFSLGDCTSMPSAYIVRFKNSGSGTLTLDRITGTDTLDGALKTLTLAPSQAVFVAKSATAAFITLNGNSPIYDVTDPSKSVIFSCSGITTGTQRTMTIPDRSSTLMTLGGAQVPTGDFTPTGAWAFAGTATVATGGTVVITSKSLGTITSGTLTPDPQVQAQQHYTNGGAHTLAPSSNTGSVLVDITNNGSAGAITTSGFTKVTGSAFTTTNTNKFRCHISIGNAGSLLIVEALQ